MAKLVLIAIVGALLVQPVTAEIGLVVSAVTAAISTGASIAGTTVSGLMSDGYKISSAIVVQNWLDALLRSPVVKLADGAVSVPPEDILPSKKEAMVVRKTAHTATGTYGTVSWFVEGFNRRVYVMWSVPFNYDFHSNWLAVGISGNGYTRHPAGNDMFNQMYYGSSSGEIGFTRGKYYNNAQTIAYRDSDIEVTGTMGTTHKAGIEITVRPLNNSRLAAPIRIQLENECQ